MTMSAWGRCVYPEHDRTETWKHTFEGPKDSPKGITPGVITHDCG